LRCGRSGWARLTRDGFRCQINFPRYLRASPPRTAGGFVGRDHVRAQQGEFLFERVEVFGDLQGHAHGGLALFRVAILDGAEIKASACQSFGP